MDSCSCHPEKLMPRLSILSQLFLFLVVSALLSTQPLIAQNSASLLSREASAPLPISSNASVIGPGDVIDIQVFNTPELSGKQEISRDGQIRIPHAGVIHLDGLSPFEAGAEIERVLRAENIMNDPEVTVLVAQHAVGQIAVLGEVNHPGIYSFQQPPLLALAVAAAGGVTAKAGSTISVTHRNGTMDRITGVNPDKPSGDHPSMIVEPSDVVLVSATGLFYVVGDVGHPGEFSLNNAHPVRALDALALAMGLKEMAAPKKASIIRTTETGVRTFPVDLDAASKNIVYDPVLEPDDILVVPHSGFKEFEFTFLPALTGAAANAVALALVTR